MNDCLLALTVAEAFAETLAEWLLVNYPEHAFTSLPAFGHGAHLHRASVEERIRARSRRTQFQLQLPRTAVEPLLAHLRHDFPRVERDAWCMPLLPLGEGGVHGG